MFNHEKFEAYHLSIEYWQRALRLLDQIPAGHAVIKDQLKRAAASIPLNIAEGSGRTRSEDRKRFYAMARGSALECAAICDLVFRIDPRLGDEVKSSKDALHAIASILSTIILR